MIKMHAPNLTSSSIRSLASLKQSQTCRTTLNLLPISFTNKNPQVYQNPTQIITVSLDHLQKHKQILQWRQNTDFPILKIKSFTLLEKKNEFASSFLEILVQLESQIKKFNDLKKLPLFQAIYVLKEAMIGFERLCHRFGFFNISAEMIMFNRTQNCKVWISKYWYSSETEPTQIKSEKEFVYELCNVVEEKAVNSKISCEFFQKIRDCKYFFEAIGCIEAFAKVNRIKIPTRLQNLEEIKSPLIRTSLTMDSNMIETKKTNMVVSAKIPRFIKKIQIKKIASHEFYTPLPRKISMATEFCANDRSFSNVSRNHSSNSFVKIKRSNNRIEEREDITFDEDTFLKDLNIRLFDPNGQESKDLIPSSSNFSENYVVNSPQTQFSPLGMVSEIDFNQDKKSGFSFNRGIKRQESSLFETAQRMFLTVCKSTTGNGLFSPVKKTKHQYSPSCIGTLQYLDSEDIKCLEEFQSPPKQTKFMPISINQIREKRKLSCDFGNTSGRLEQEQEKVIEQQELQTPKYKTTNLLNVPKQGQAKIGMVKSPSHLVFCSSRKNRQDFQLEQEQKEQQEREFLRQNIIGINGWKGLSILKDKTQIQTSFVDQDQNITIPGQTKTSELPKLGGMGKEVKTSMINDFEFEMEYGDQIEKARSVRNEFIGLLD